MFGLEKTKKISLAMGLALSIFSISGVCASENTDIGEKSLSSTSSLDVSDEKVEFKIDGKGTLKGYKGSAKEITIPDNVKAIACGVFMNNSELEKVNLPEGLERVGQYSFYSCKALKEITLPDSVKRVGKLAFGDCENCLNVYLGENLMDVGDAAFLGCSSLKSIDVNKNNENFVSYNGMLFNKDCSILRMCPAGLGPVVELPESTTSIACYAFLSCKNIEKIERLGNKFLDIQDAAFYGCEKLKELSMSEQIRSIGACAFAQCTSLEEFTINKDVEHIGSAAFMECTSLKRVNCLAKNLKPGYDLFALCPQNIIISTDKDSLFGRYASKHSDHLVLI